jgi:hypothetical protein
MAKNKSKTTRPAVRRRRAIRATPNNSDTLDIHAAKAAGMLYDPCTADLVPSVYPGDRGYVNRFVFNRNLGTGAGLNSFIYAFKPGNTLAFAAEFTGPDITATVAWGNDVPGASFLGGASATSARSRCTGFCMTARPISSPNLVTGTLHFGIIPAGSLSQGVTVSPNIVAAMCTESVSASQAAMAPLDVKWCPGSFDDRYSPSWTAGFVGDDDTDRNLIVIVGVGFPTTGGCAFRVTGIHEWSPKVNFGIVTDSTSTKPSRCDKDCVLRKLKEKDPNWWWSIGKKTVGVAKDLISGYYTGGAFGVMGAMAKFV